MISVTPRSRSREDRAGDPLDGLVNLFDLGIVLAVAFLLAALSSLHLGQTITSHGLKTKQAQQIYVRSGTKAGTVYRLADGRLVYVQAPPGSRTSTTRGH